MKVKVKTLKKTQFEIEVNLEDTVADVKKHIESVQGSDVYPAARQMLIHKGKVLKDGTTLQQNEVSENSSMVIMLSENKSSSAPLPTQVAAPELPPVTIAPPAPAAQPPPVPPAPPIAPNANPLNLFPHATQPPPPPPALSIGPNANPLNLFPYATQPPPPPALSIGPNANPLNLFPHATQPPPPPALSIGPNANPLNLFPQPSQPPPPPPAPPIGLNANPLNLFPQGVASGASGNLDFLRDDLQFQALRSMVLAHPSALELILQHWERRSPQHKAVVHEHRDEFTRMINDPEPLRWETESLSITLEDLDAIYRLQAMGFNGAVVWEVYYAFDKNEELAANFLRNLMHDSESQSEEE